MIRLPLKIKSPIIAFYFSETTYGSTANYSNRYPAPIHTRTWEEREIERDRETERERPKLVFYISWVQSDSFFR